MEYNSLSDILAKFSCTTPWIQAVIIVSAAIVPVSFFYFLKAIIFKIVETLLLKTICNRNVEERAKAASALADKIFTKSIVLRNN